jgi:hypothetical protein
MIGATTHSTMTVQWAFDGFQSQVLAKGPVIPYWKMEPYFNIMTAGKING